MERGQLGIEDQSVTAFVFEGLIAHPPSGRFRRKNDVTQWTFDIQVCDYIHDLITRRGVAVEVITWRTSGFAEAVHDQLWLMDVPVRQTRSGSYALLSHRIATDPTVSLVYDADPHHRFGYGFKAREFSIGRI
jgi:hypothetical protein